MCWLSGSHACLPRHLFHIDNFKAGTRWSPFLQPGEVIILATRVLKRRFLSVKSRQLILVDTPPVSSISTPIELPVDVCLW